MKLTPEQDNLINELAADLKPMVSKIEAGIKTTQNNYGRYGGLLAQLAHGNKLNAKVIGIALVRAGANAQGVADGLKMSFGDI